MVFLADEYIITDGIDYAVAAKRDYHNQPANQSISEA